MPNWDEAAMQDAIDRVNSGQENVNQVSKSFGIPRTTLMWRLKAEGGDDSVLGVGRPSVFTAAEENIIANVVRVAQDRLLPMTSSILMSHIQDILIEEVSFGIRRKIPAGFKNNMPSRKWLTGFIKRNNISFRTPESYSKSRGNVTEEEIRQWFSDTKEYLDSHPELLEAVNDLKRVFNIDETGARLSPISGKVLALKGRRDTGQIAVGNEKSSVTVLATICGSGQWVPPLLMLPYKRIPGSVVENIPDYVVVGASPKGWISSESLFEYLCNTFDKWLTQNGVQRPVIVWCDWHSTRLNYHTISETLERGIILLGLPKNTTHIMQPLDTHIFGPLKQGWKEEVARLTFDDIELRKDTFGEHFFKFYENFMDKRSTTIMDSFKDTGLCPLNPNQPKYSKLRNKERNTQATEGIKFKVIESNKTRASAKTYKVSGTQTLKTGISKGTNTLESNALVSASSSASSIDTSIRDDMVLSLHSEKENKTKLQNRANANFGGMSKEQSVIRSRSDLFISDVFRGHKFFPSPAVQSDKRKQKTKAVELLPNAISSKEWKAYASSKRNDQKEERKRKLDKVEKDKKCPPPKRRPGRPRKIPETVCDSSIKIMNSYTGKGKVGTRKPEVDDEIEVLLPSQGGNESEVTSVLYTPVDVERRSKVFSSTVKINTLTKPKRLCTGKAPAIKSVTRSFQMEEEKDDSTLVKLENAGGSTIDADVQVGEYLVVSHNDDEVPGRVTKCLRNRKLMISLMENSTEHAGWKWPEKPKISSFYIQAVKKKLDDPEMVEGDGLVFKFDEI